MHTGKEYQVEEVGQLRLKRVKTDELDRRLRGLRHRRHQGGARHHDRRHDHRRRPAGRRAPARLQGGQAGRLLLDLPDRDRRLRGPRPRPREAADQRRRPDLPEGLLAGARLRLPLRLPRPAPPRRRPGAAGARVQPVAAPLRPLGALRDHAVGRRDRVDRQPGLLPGPVRHREGARAVHQGHDPDPRALPGAGHGALPRAPGDQHHLRVPGRRPPAGALRAAARRDPVRLLRPPEEHDPGLRLVRLRAGRLPRDRPGQGGHPGQRREGRRPLPARPPREGAHAGACTTASGWPTPSPASSSRSPSRARSAATSSPALRSPPSARTSPPSATAATSAASASSWRSRRKARSG